MPNRIDIIFVNAQLLPQWIAYMDAEDGLPTKLTKSKTAGTKRFGKILLKLQAAYTEIGAEAGVAEETTTTETAEYLKNMITIAKDISLTKRLMKAMTTYSQACSLYDRGEITRFVLIQGYVSWLPVEALDSVWSGDIVIPEGNNNLAQHIIRFDGTQNRARSPVGTHCRHVFLLSYWHDRFKPSTDTILSDCEAVLVWD